MISYEGGQFSLFFVEDFTDRKGLMRCKCTVPHFSQEAADAGGITEHAADVAEAVRTVRCVVTEGQDFFDIDNGIDPEAGQPLVQPPVDHPVDLFADLRVLPVEVGLLFVENMQIKPVFVTGQLFPDLSAEIRTPVAGENISVRRADGVVRTSIFLHCAGFIRLFQLTEIEILPVFPFRIPACFLEPLVFIRAVVYDQIHNDMLIPLFGLCKEAVHVLHCAEAGVNIVVIGDIISLVGQRGPVDRREPDYVHPQVFEIVEFFDNAGDVSDAVAIRVVETLGIDLISDLVMPPLSFHKQEPPFSWKNRADVMSLSGHGVTR